MVGRCNWTDLSTKTGRGSSEIRLWLEYEYETHRTMLSHAKVLLLLEEKVETVLSGEGDVQPRRFRFRPLQYSTW